MKSVKKVYKAQENCKTDTDMASLSRKRFRLASEQRKTEERDPRPPPPRSFTCAIFRAVFDSRSSFFAPKQHGNACYAGYEWQI